MKTEGRIKHKLSQVRFRHLKREVRNGLSRKSENCSFNGKIELPVLGQVGVCLHGAGTPDWNGGVCDGNLDNRAEGCSLYQCLNTKERLKSDFDEFLKTSEFGAIAERYPDMAALVWVLDDMEETAREISEPTETLEEPKEEPVVQESKEGLEDFSTLGPSFEIARFRPTYFQIVWAWLLGFFRRG